MTRHELLKQAQELVSLQPGLSVQELIGGVMIKGTYILNASYQDVPILEEYQVSIIVPDQFPNRFPEIRETSRKVPREFSHFMAGGALCLGAPSDLIACLAEVPTITHYVSSLLDSYLYAAEYWKKYGVFPDYGEQPHGVQGRIEAYRARYLPESNEALMKYLYCLAGKGPNPDHKDCPYYKAREKRNCAGCPVFRDRNAWYGAMLQSDAIDTLKQIGWRTS